MSIMSKLASSLDLSQVASYLDKSKSSFDAKTLEKGITAWGIKETLIKAYKEKDHYSNYMVLVVSPYVSSWMTALLLYGPETVSGVAFKLCVDNALVPNETYNDENAKDYIRKLEKTFEIRVKQFANFLTYLYGMHEYLMKVQEKTEEDTMIADRLDKLFGRIFAQDIYIYPPYKNTPTDNYYKFSLKTTGENVEFAAESVQSFLTLGDKERNVSYKKPAAEETASYGDYYKSMGNEEMKEVKIGRIVELKESIEPKDFGRDKILNYIVHDSKSKVRETPIVCRSELINGFVNVMIKVPTKFNYLSEIEVVYPYPLPKLEKVRDDNSVTDVVKINEDGTKTSLRETLNADGTKIPPFQLLIPLSLTLYDGPELQPPEILLPCEVLCNDDYKSEACSKSLSLKKGGSKKRKTSRKAKGRTRRRSRI